MNIKHSMLKQNIVYFLEFLHLLNQQFSVWENFINTCFNTLQTKLDHNLLSLKMQFQKKIYYHYKHFSIMNSLFSRFSNLLSIGVNIIVMNEINDEFFSTRGKRLNSLINNKKVAGNSFTYFLQYFQIKLSFTKIIIIITNYFKEMLSL